ncbi:MAG: hypothetical protein QG589_339 [Patescibacteria group bacterium]|nr:hypothetical protein [Patescibacteria group bacterium]
MQVNGRFVSPRGKSFAQIGKLLQEASPAKDGVGLRVELTEAEEGVFEGNFGLAIGKAICEVIADAVREAGGNPNGFKFTYSNLVFVTTANV